MVTSSEQESVTVRKAVLGDGGAFASSWLRDKSVTPVPAGSQMDAALSRRIEAGCRATGSAHMLVADLSEEVGVRTVPTSPFPSVTSHGAIRPPSLLVTPDLRGAVLFPEAGYALIAGTPDFMTAAVAEGIDTARSRFGRYARTLSRRHPGLSGVAGAYPPAHTAWSHVADIDPASATARQLALLDELRGGTRSAPDFAREWWEARRTSQANGERVRGSVADLLDRVFMILEDYSIDPELSEPGDLSDAELRDVVSEVWDAFRHDNGSFGS